MSLPLVFHDDYSPPLPPGHRFPMEKFRLLRDHLVDSGLTTDAALRRPMLCSHDVLNLAHDADYVARYCSGDMSPAELRRLGLPWSPALAQRTVRAVGGSLLTAELALQHGLACHRGRRHPPRPSRPCLGLLHLQRSGGSGAVSAGKRTSRPRADLRLRRASGRRHRRASSTAWRTR